jgi:hypothetical protein
MSSESFRERTFVVDDPDARLRDGTAFDRFITDAAGRPRTIAKGTTIKLRSVRTEPAGAKAVNIFVEATDEAGVLIGWTSAGNLAGKLLSETIGEIPPANGNRFGPNAAWSNGEFAGQVTLVKVVGTGSQIEFIAQPSATPFLALVAAARHDGRLLGMNSGFRTFAEQKHLFDGFQRKLPGFNPANRPGNSNHQSGIAFDLDVKPGDGNPTYEWMKVNATAHGFVRTVSREPWHWEYLPEKAAAARQRGVFGTFM